MNKGLVIPSLMEENEANIFKLSEVVESLLMSGVENFHVEINNLNNQKPALGLDACKLIRDLKTINFYRCTEKGCT